MLKRDLRKVQNIPVMLLRSVRFSSKSSPIDLETEKALEDGYAKLAGSNSNSLLKKHLTKPIFNKLKTLVTPTFNSTLLDCIQSGICNLDSSVGIYAPDSEAYTTFADIFNPIIEEYHGFENDAIHPDPDYGDMKKFCNVDPDRRYVVSTRIRCARSIEGFPLNPCMKEQDYVHLEASIKNALNSLDGEQKGKYYALCDMDPKTQQKLIDDHFLFKEGDRFLQAANASRFWPVGRGIFFNKKKNFLVWVNEEDHLRIISMDKGGNLRNIFKRLVKGVCALENCLSFSRDTRFGFLTFCPTNLGTTIRASVHIKLPNLARDMEKLECLAAQYKLQVRGTHGEHSDAEGGIYDVSNKQRLGITERDAVLTMQDGILELIEAEQQME